MYKTYPEALAAATAAGLKGGDPMTQEVGDARAAQNAYLEALVGTPQTVAKVKNLQIPGPYGDIAVRLTYPSTTSDLPVVLYVRGGGWWCGTLDASTAVVNRFSNASNCVVCSIDYRSAPEYPYPTQFNEVMAVIDWLRASGKAFGVDAQKLSLFGDSAGASLALAAAMQLRDAEKPQALGIVQLYTNALGPPPDGKPISNWVWNNYLPTAAVAREVSAVPMNGSVHDLPPMWLGVGDLDHIVKDTLELAARCQESGVEHVLRRWPDLPHGFFQFTSSLEPATQAIDEAAQFVQALNQKS